jgi:hypothetical protein
MNSWDRAAQIMEQRAAAQSRPRPRPATEAARPRPRVQAFTVTELGGKLDALTGLIERATSAYTPIRENAPTSEPAPEPAPVAVPTAAELAAMGPEAFREWSTVRWSTAFDHVGAGSSGARPMPEFTAAELAKLDPETFRALSAVRWSAVHGHLPGGRR